MQDSHINSSISPSNVHIKVKKFSALNRFIAHHPYLSALLLVLYFAAISQLFILIYRPLEKNAHLSFLLANLIGESFYALVVAVPLILLGWWSATGFTQGVSKRQLTLFLGPVLLIVFPALCAFAGIVGRTNWVMWIQALLLVLLIGFTEEGLFRGLILRTLLPRGIWPAVLLSAFLFSALHLVNLLTGLPLSYVVGQMLGAIGIGTLLAALRLRSYSIWPAVLLHALFDFNALLLMNIMPRAVLSKPLSLVLAVNGIYCLLALINTFVLLRPSRLSMLRIAYGLQVAPEVIPAPIAPAYSGLPESRE